MPQVTEPDNELTLLIGLAVALAVILLLVGFALFFHDFSRELKYLNSEIKRAEGTERRYWLKKRRQLWFSIIPFIKY